MGEPPQSVGTLWTRPFVTVLVAQMAFGYAGSTFLLLPKFLATRFSASASAIGHVTAVQALAAVVAIPFLSGGIDRVGRKPLISLGCALTTLYATAWLGVGRLSGFIDLLQVVNGVGFMIAFNSAGALVADQAPPERLGEAIGIFGAANMAMSAIAPAIAELLAVRVGWRAAFGLAAAVGLGSFVLSRRIVELPRAAEQPAERLELRATLALVRRLLAPTFAMATCGAAYGAVYTFYQPFVIAQGAAHVSGFFVGFTVAAVSVRLFFGSLPDRLGRRRAALYSYVLFALMVLAMTQLTPDRLLWFGFLFGCTHGVFYPSLSAFCVEQSHASERGRVMTLVMGAFRVGNMASAITLGSVAERHGYPSVFVLAAIVSALGVAALAVRQEKAAPALE